MKLLFSIVLGLAAITEVMTLALPSEVDVARVIPNLKSDLAGLVHLGDDGILRSFDGSGNVIDFARLDQTQLQAVINWYSGDKQDQAHLQGLWANIDSSRALNEEQIWNPPQHILPTFISALPKAPLMSSAQESNPLKLHARFCTALHCQINSDCYLRDPLCPRCFAVDSFPRGDCLPSPS
ncbi:hypothetical protein EMCG_00936 [[Emmonsia] crescens]|uniref:Uncharacterized protein n=1 Tax=[Emmonsia] crescens TaxID=73230 RepID=A0A0G2HNM3_9EURO|nr:hypothetical protein EMCG_00936 [Emmonsia crescens UAMH 3008]